MKHTPTPWKSTRYGELRTKHGNLIGKILTITGSREADAAFIVRSVNCHEELVKALKAVRVSLIGDEYYQEFKPLLKTVDEAITKAEIL